MASRTGDSFFARTLLHCPELDFADPSQLWEGGMIRGEFNKITLTNRVKWMSQENRLELWVALREISNRARSGQELDMEGGAALSALLLSSNRVPPQQLREGGVKAHFIALARFFRNHWDRVGSAALVAQLETTQRDLRRANEGGNGPAVTAIGVVGEAEMDGADTFLSMSSLGATASDASAGPPPSEDYLSDAKAHIRAEIMSLRAIGLTPQSGDNRRAILTKLTELQGMINQSLVEDTDSAIAIFSAAIDALEVLVRNHRGDALEADVEGAIERVSKIKHLIDGITTSSTMEQLEVAVNRRMGNQFDVRQMARGGNVAAEAKPELRRLVLVPFATGAIKSACRLMRSSIQSAEARTEAHENKLRALEARYKQLQKDQRVAKRQQAYMDACEQLRASRDHRIAVYEALYEVQQLQKLHEDGLHDALLHRVRFAQRASDKSEMRAVQLSALSVNFETCLNRFAEIIRLGGEAPEWYHEEMLNEGPLPDGLTYLTHYLACVNAALIKEQASAQDSVTGWEVTVESRAAVVTSELTLLDDRPLNLLDRDDEGEEGARGASEESRRSSMVSAEPSEWGAEHDHLDANQFPSLVSVRGADNGAGVFDSLNADTAVPVGLVAGGSAPAAAPIAAAAAAVSAVVAPTPAPISTTHLTQSQQRVVYGTFYNLVSAVHKTQDHGSWGEIVFERQDGWRDLVKDLSDEQLDEVRRVALNAVRDQPATS